ncbi:NifB/NifX family molybdenum-iron cluster-binding protein [Oleidesulfovibrio sp.]|uniref:NifB/NifX family molybdenum-iron cluster-binding protein n=1 Tax=Oleidesulfovibrio sp. TaxID=2909707 RepID=UPI003A8871D2
MIIAISAAGNTPESNLDPRFGRAAGFVLFNSETGEFTYKDNTQNLNAAQGAGIQAAMNVADTGAAAVITGHVGPKAFQALQQGQVAVYLTDSPTVNDALEAFRQGMLKPADQADKQGHW